MRLRFTNNQRRLRCTDIYNVNGAVSNPERSAWPRLFAGAPIATELIAALCKHGPVRAACAKRAFTDEIVRSLARPRYHSSNLLSTSPAFTRRSGKDQILGINPRFSLAAELRDLMIAMTTVREQREIVRDLSAVEIEKFNGWDHPEVVIESLFGTAARTRTLVVLHVMDGECTNGKLARSVLDHFSKAIELVLKRLQNDGVLVREGNTVRFNQREPWIPELRALLEALIPCMPEVVGYARMLKTIRAGETRGGTYAHGQRFHIFGSRVNEAILAYLAANGPSPLMQLTAAAGSVTTHAVDPLVESGMVAKVEVDATGWYARTLYSLNAAHPAYREIKALLRTSIVLDAALPHRRSRLLYEGSDLAAPDSDFDPSVILGVARCGVSTRVLTTLAYCIHGEIDVASLVRLLGEHNYDVVAYKTLARFSDLGAVIRRRSAGMWLYRLNPEWAGARQLRDLLLAIGRAWPEFVDDVEGESRLYSPPRRGLEKTIAAERRELGIRRVSDPTYLL